MRFGYRDRNKSGRMMSMLNNIIIIILNYSKSPILENLHRAIFKGQDLKRLMICYDVNVMLMIVI